MSPLKDQLIKLGSKRPQLRGHLRPILDHLTTSRGRRVEASTFGRLADVLQELGVTPLRGEGNRNSIEDYFHQYVVHPNGLIAGEAWDVLPSDVTTVEETSRQRMQYSRSGKVTLRFSWLFLAEYLLDELYDYDAMSALGKQTLRDIAGSQDFQRLLSSSVSYSDQNHGPVGAIDVTRDLHGWYQRLVEGELGQMDTWELRKAEFTWAPQGLIVTWYLYGWK